MRLDDLDPSKNVRDLGTGRGGGFGGGGGLGGLIGLLPMLLGRKMGFGTIIIIAIVGYFMFSGGGLGLTGGTPASQTSSGDNVACDTAAEAFSCKVLASTEQVWGSIFQQQGERYQPTVLSFYDRSAQSGCGAAQSAMGPFYCPTDKNIYLDTAFYNEMASRMGAGGDTAQAYVIAHEVGHHIQDLTGVLDQARGMQARASQAEGNAIQVRVELQADCYAGVWVARAKDAHGRAAVEPGDVEEGLRAAHQIGDDTLMKSAGQNPVESMFTHGSSQQRMTWLKRGIETGNPAQCDTFNAPV
ncbi:zinc metalloprotease [Sphingorhabdus soli]|uniref:Zinc metalloprotease n=1 Tax=Flavisphingopyxis soli TaxID=2601267 RepID=A0A5C6U761_9SPHN|nr:neutral zinc metallopeptidase [Sphingorhabdus soli]TXC68669.1 zinc metalloprotease [Sphingorhabdus soli]